MLYHIESLKAGSSEYNDTLAKVIAELKPHIAAEETQDLPALESHLGAAKSKDVAASFTRTKMFVPTRLVILYGLMFQGLTHHPNRAHPSAPDKPPFETVAGLMAAPMDQLKDMLSKFPTEEMKQDAATRGH